LRELSKKVIFPCEMQATEQIISTFAHHYFEMSGTEYFRTEEDCFNLTFMVLVLNTELTGKVDKKIMSLVEFEKRCSEFISVDSEFLRSIYKKIIKKPLHASFKQLELA